MPRPDGPWAEGRETLPLEGRELLPEEGLATLAPPEGRLPPDTSAPLLWPEPLLCTGAPDGWAWLRDAMPLEEREAEGREALPEEGLAALAPPEGREALMSERLEALEELWEMPEL